MAFRVEQKRLLLPTSSRGSGAFLYIENPSCATTRLERPNPYQYHTMAAKAVHRVTMFKVPKAENVQPILEQYAKLQSEAKKVGASCGFVGSKAKQ